MNMNQESKRQELGRRLVDREVYYCVSSLVGTLSALAQNVGYSVQRNEGISWEEDIAPLLESTNYEEAATSHVTECEDLYDLELMAENVGFWSDAIELTGYDSAQEYADSDGEMGTIDFDTWFEDHCTDDEKKAVLDTLQGYIINNTSNYEEFCLEHDVDTDEYREEVYEHWLVSNWLARKLSERGYVTGNLCGLTIWGRCCTGQAICLDHVIQEIACELWPEDLKEDAS